MATIDQQRLIRTLFNLLPARVQGQLMARVRLPRARILLPGNETLNFDRTDVSEIFRSLCWRGFEGFEYESVKLFYELSRNSSVILDVGAYFGYYALIAAKANPNATVHAFEPLHESAELIEHYAQLNDCHVDVHNICLGNTVGDVEFFVPDTSNSRIPNIGSLIQRFGPGHQYSDRNAISRTVGCATLDSLGLSPDLIKLDVEDGELQVLKGSLKTIETCRPDIIMEVIDDRSAASDWLISMGYQMQPISTRVGGHGKYGEYYFRHTAKNSRPKSSSSAA